MVSQNIRKLSGSILEEIQEAALTDNVSEYWIKAVRHHVAVEVVDPFEGQQVTRILKGDITIPDADLSDAIIPLYTRYDIQFFKMNNKTLIETGVIVPYTPEFREEQLINSITDEEIVEAIDKPFFAVKALLDRFTSPVPIERMLRKAKEHNKTVGVIAAMEERLSELQADEYGEE